MARFGIKLFSVHTLWRLGLIYVGLLLLVAGCQRTFIYFPMRNANMDRMADAGGWLPWLAPGGAQIGWRIPMAEGAESAPPILMFHGNSGSATWRKFWVSALQKSGFGEVRVLEYPGYGDRAGRPGETTLINAGTEAVRLWSEELGEPVFVLGESLGSGVAAGVYEKNPEFVRGILLAVPYDSIAAVGQGRLPWLPIRLFLKDKFDSVSRLQNAQVPIVIVGVTQDEVIPVKHARNLYESIRESGRVLYIELDEARHDDLPQYIHEWAEPTLDFLTQD